MVTQLQQTISENQAALVEESQKVTKLQMEIDARDSEIEYLKNKVSFQGVDTASVHSSNDLETEDSMHGNGLLAIDHNLSLS